MIMNKIYKGCLLMSMLLIPILLGAQSHVRKAELDNMLISAVQHYQIPQSLSLEHSHGIIN